MADLPDRVVVGEVEFSRVDSDDSIACWTWLGQVSLVVEPADVPGPEQLAVAATVVSRFAELVEVAADHLRRELSASGFAEPAAVVFADGTWMLRFAESSLDLADPYGIGVLFEGTTPTAVEDLSDAEPV